MEAENSHRDITSHAIDITSKIFNQELLQKADLSLMEVAKALGESMIQPPAEDLDDPIGILPEAIIEDQMEEERGDEVMQEGKRKVDKSKQLILKKLLKSDRNISMKEQNKNPSSSSKNPQKQVEHNLVDQKDLMLKLTSMILG
jgi:hypothetical protein